MNIKSEIETRLKFVKKQIDRLTKILPHVAEQYGDTEILAELSAYDEEKWALESELIALDFKKRMSYICINNERAQQ